MYQSYDQFVAAYAASFRPSTWTWILTIAATVILLAAGLVLRRLDDGYGGPDRRASRLSLCLGGALAVGLVLTYAWTRAWDIPIDEYGRLLLASGVKSTGIAPDRLAPILLDYVNLIGASDHPDGGSHAGPAIAWIAAALATVAMVSAFVLVRSAEPDWRLGGYAFGAAALFFVWIGLGVRTATPEKSLLADFDRYAWNNGVLIASASGAPFEFPTLVRRPDGTLAVDAPASPPPTAR